MNDIDVTDRNDLCLLLRSKTALGRLVETEVHSVLDFLESIGFMHMTNGAAPFDPVTDESTVVPPPVEPVPVIAPPPAS